VHVLCGAPGYVERGPRVLRERVLKRCVLHITRWPSDTLKPGDDLL
jgi:hypothetical protein